MLQDCYLISEPLYTPVLLWTRQETEVLFKKKHSASHAIKVSNFLKLYIWQFLKVMFFVRPHLATCKNPDLRCMGLWVLELVAAASF